MDVAAVVIAAIGAAVVLEAIARCWRRRINAGAADPIVVKLARAGNLERVKKLAAVAPDSYLEVYAHAITAAETATQKDPVTIAALTHPAFDRHGAALNRAWRTVSLRGLFGAALGGAGLFLGYQDHYTPSHLRVLGGLSALASVWFLAHLGDLTRALAIGRADVLPEIDRAITGIPESSPAEVDSAE
jgi:hypothetical protein